jgi:hypothetical protein
VQLNRCLKSLFEADHTHLKIEVYVGLHDPDAQTSSLCHQHFPSVKTFEFEAKLTAGEIRNRLIECSRPSYYLFIDDDTIIPIDFFIKAYPYLTKGATVIGGPDLCPPSSSFFQAAFAVSQKSPMISAHTRYRHGSQFDNHSRIPTVHDFILCNLWVHAKVFHDYHLKFPPDFKRNEENILLHHIALYSQHFIFQEALFIFHEKKSALLPLVKAVYQSGFYRMKSFLRFPSSTSLFFLIPMLFILYLILLVLLYTPIALLPLLSFLILTLFFSLKLAFNDKKGARIFFTVYFLHLMIILVYAIGTIAGLREIYVEKNHSDSI